MLYLVEQCAAEPGFEAEIANAVEAARISQLLIQLKIKRLYIAPQRAALGTVEGFLRCAETAERGIQIVVDYSISMPDAVRRPLGAYARYGIMRTHQIQGHAPPASAEPGTQQHVLHVWQWWSQVVRDIMDSPVPTAVVADADTVLALQTVVDSLTPARALAADPGRVVEYGPAMLGWEYRRTI